MTHQDQSSPGSTDRKIGCPASRAWRLACRLGDESQQPIYAARLGHIRRWSHVFPILRHSSQPATGPVGLSSLHLIQMGAGHGIDATGRVPGRAGSSGPSSRPACPSPPGSR